jgi:hypothetical protein
MLPHGEYGPAVAYSSPLVLSAASVLSQLKLSEVVKSHQEVSSRFWRHEVVVDVAPAYLSQGRCAQSLQVIQGRTWVRLFPSHVVQQPLASAGLSHGVTEHSLASNRWYTMTRGTVLTLMEGV